MTGVFNSLLHCNRINLTEVPQVSQSRLLPLWTTYTVMPLSYCRLSGAVPEENEVASVAKLFSTVWKKLVTRIYRTLKIVAFNANGTVRKFCWVPWTITRQTHRCGCPLRDYLKPHIRLVFSKLPLYRMDLFPGINVEHPRCTLSCKWYLAFEIPYVCDIITDLFSLQA